MISNTVDKIKFITAHSRMKIYTRIKIAISFIIRIAMHEDV